MAKCRVCDLPIDKEKDVKNGRKHNLKVMKNI